MVIEQEKQNLIQLEPKLDKIADNDPEKQSKKLILLSQIKRDPSNL